TVESLLRAKVWILCDNVEMTADRPLIDVGMNPTAEILRDELIGPLVFIEDLCLPGQIVRDDIVLEVFPLQFVAGIQDAVSWRKIFPSVHELPPIDQSPKLVDRAWHLIFLLQPFQKRSIHVLRGNSGGKCFVVDLISDDCWMILKMTDNLPNHPLCVLP